MNGVSLGIKLDFSLFTLFKTYPFHSYVGKNSLIDLIETALTPKRAPFFECFFFVLVDGGSNKNKISKISLKCPSH